MKGHEEVPQLEAPGMGLPLLQELVLKYLAFPIIRRKYSWQQAQDRFIQEGGRIRNMVLSIPEELRTKRVLVPRMIGIEDSSRYWSLTMTLDHILIVSTGVLGLMNRLSQGESIDHVVDTAKVKPGSEYPADIESRFDQLLAQVPARLDGVDNRDIGNCHLHPWFGCLNPHGWLVMLAIHQFIHRRQVERICDSLLKLEQHA